MKNMAVAVGIGALLCAGRANGQVGFATTASCLSSPAVVDGCASGLDQRNPAGNDLTPTQWLFGTDVSSKLAQTSIVLRVQSAAHVDWHSITRVAQGAVMPTRRRRAPTAPPSRVDTASVPADPATTQRFLVEEWRQAELSAVDSVYHESIAQLAATFDSAQRAHVAEPQWTAILRRLDGLLTADNYTWAQVRAHIEERADSALAMVDASVHGSQ